MGVTRDAEGEGERWGRGESRGQYKGGRREMGRAREPSGSDGHGVEAGETRGGERSGGGGVCVLVGKRDTWGWGKRET